MGVLFIMLVRIKYLFFAFSLFILVLTISLVDAADYIVADAGTAAYNGDYTEAGTHNEKPYYLLDGNGHYLYVHSGSDKWALYTELSDVTQPAYEGPASTTTPDDGDWVVEGGAAPAPTVTAAAGDEVPYGYHISPTNDSTCGSGEINVSVNWTDDIEIDNATIRIYNASGSQVDSQFYDFTGKIFAVIGLVYNYILDGIYYWTSEATDTANQLIYLANYTLNIDATPPVMEITSPTNLTYYSEVDEMSNTVTGGETCWYSTDFSEAIWITNTTYTCGNNILELHSKNGTNVWGISGNDSVNNLAMVTVTFNYTQEGVFEDSLHVFVGKNKTTGATKVLVEIDQNGYLRLQSKNGTLYTCYVANDGTFACV